MEKNYLINHIDKTLDFLNKKENIEKVLKESKREASKLRDLTDADFAFGSGYPYYLLGAEDIYIGEYQRYFSELKTLVKNTNVFPCIECIKNTKLKTNIKNHCKNCTKTNLKPIDIIRALPDLDIILIFKSIPDLNRLDVILKNNNYYSVGENLEKTILETKNFYDNRDGRLHSDIYIGLEKDIVKAYKNISMGNLIGSKLTLFAYHEVWERYETMLGLDLFFAGIEDFLIQPETEISLIRKQSICSYLKCFDNIDSAYENWKSFLKEYDHKNYRILSSSKGIENRIKKKIYKIETYI